MSGQHVDDLLDLYALGALEPDEASAVDSHLEGCPECRARLAEATDVVAHLAWTPAPRTPPPALQGKIRRHIEALQREERDALQAPSIASSASRPRRGGQSPRPLFWRGVSLPLRVAMTAALTLLLVLAGWNVLLQRRLTTLSAQVAEQQRVAAMLRTPGARVITLVAQPAAPTAHGNLFIDPAGTNAYLVADGLPSLPEDKAYQLWLTEGEARTSAAVFRANADGATALFVRSPKQLASYTGCGITIEPATGSEWPTGERVLRSQVWQGEGGWE